MPTRFIDSPFPTKAEYMRWCALQQSDDPPRTLTDLPDDIWPSIIAHSLDAYLVLPVLAKPFSASFSVPKLRAKCLQRVLECAAALKAVVPPTTDQQLISFTPSLAEQLSRRAALMRLRAYIRSLAVRAIRAHDVEILNQCIDDFGLLEAEPNEAMVVGNGFHIADYRAMQLLRLCMIHDFAYGVQVLISRPSVELPACGNPPGMEAELGAMFMRPDLLGQTVMHMAPTELPDFNPLFIGVRCGSVAAARALLRRLSTLERVKAGESTMSGDAYVARALSDAYLCCGKLAMPTFGCGTAQGRFYQLWGAEFMQAFVTPTHRWSLLQMELRKADPQPAMVQLLLDAMAQVTTAEQLPTTSTASEASSAHRLPENHPEKEPIRRLLAAKRRALEVMAKRADGQDPDEALCEALKDAARVARAAPAGGAVQDTAPSERNPNLLLKEGGWFAVNSEAARVANFEAAAELVESAFCLHARD